MKLTSHRAALMLAAVATIAWTTACQTKTEVKTGNENGPVSSATPQASASQPEVAKVETKAPAATGSLATPTEAYKTGYAARQNKDIAGLKRVFAKSVIEFLTMLADGEKKSLDDQLKTLSETPQGKTDESRNEKINGNRATLEYLDEKGKWTTMDFVKEGNDWKISLPTGP